MTEKIKIKFCPKCELTNINMTAGGISGNMVCADCGFSSVIFPEKEVDLDSVEENKQKENKK